VTRHSQPLFSVVIPTFHRNEALSLCLDRLAPHQQSGLVLVAAGTHADPVSTLPTYEVIVADAGTSHTAAAVINARYPWARWVPCPGRGPGPTRNKGASIAQGDWLVFVDDDCVPESTYLNAIDAVRTADTDVIEGRILVRDKIDSPFRRQPENNVGGVYWSGNLSIRRDAFISIGAFDEDYEAACEDMDLAHRIRSRGLCAKFASEAVVWHPSHVETLSAMIRRLKLFRWHLLYRLKIGASAPLDAPRSTALANLAAWHCTDELRRTWHLVSRHDPAQWKGRLVLQLWAWLTLPARLPYLMMWELRFRRMLRERSAGQNENLTSCGFLQRPR
jgi:GT2 family glycosyltransferase